MANEVLRFRLWAETPGGLMAPFAPSGQHPDIANIDFFGPEEHKRAETLLSIVRYHDLEMKHRPTVYVHSVRAAGLGYVIATFLEEGGWNINPLLVLNMLNQHDLGEGITGDTPAPEKTRMPEEKKEQAKQAEAAAVQKLAPISQTPRDTPDVTELYKEYMEGKTLEARVSKFVDLLDVRGEALNEIIGGGNRPDFAQVLENNRVRLEEHKGKNGAWVKTITDALGEEFIGYPAPDSLVCKDPKELNYTDVEAFINSLCEGNPRFYWIWLQAGFRCLLDNFIALTLPGWVNEFPFVPLADSGILIPAVQTPDFHRSLSQHGNIPELFEILLAKAPRSPIIIPTRHL